jgi:hypothetical protein
MKQSGSQKIRLTPIELPHDREAGGSGSVGGRNVRERAPKIRNEEQEADLGGDRRTSNDNDVEDENYVDPRAFHVRCHGKEPATNQGVGEDEEADLGGQEGDQDVDPMDEDEDDGACRLKIVKPIYMFPNKLVKYHGTGMTKKL